MPFASVSKRVPVQAFHLEISFIHTQILVHSHVKQRRKATLKSPNEKKKIPTGSCYWHWRRPRAGDWTVHFSLCQWRINNNFCWHFPAHSAWIPQRLHKFLPFLNYYFVYKLLCFLCHFSNKRKQNTNEISRTKTCPNEWIRINLPLGRPVSMHGDRVPLAHGLSIRGSYGNKSTIPTPLFHSPRNHLKIYKYSCPMKVLIIFPRSRRLADYFPDYH